MQLVHKWNVEVIEFPVIWAVSGGAWLIRATVLAESPAHRVYDPTGELVDFVVASVCLDLILAGSGKICLGFLNNKTCRSNGFFQ